MPTFFAPPDALDVLDAAYRFDLDDDAWLRGVLERIGPHIGGPLGAVAYYVDASRPDDFRVWSYQGIGDALGPTSRAAFERWNEAMPLAFKRAMHLFGASGVGTPAPAGGRFRRGRDRREPRRAHRIPDMFGVNAIDVTGRGCTFAGFQHATRASASGPPRRTRPSGAASRRTSPQQRAFDELLPSAPKAESNDPSSEAVLSPRGTVEHTLAPASSTPAVELLRRAVRDRERARTRSKAIRGEELTDLWRALVAGRWTLVDTFDAHGKRHIIATRNDPRPELSRLTPREQQVANGAMFGHANKLIAYELGLSVSTVSTLLRRAAKKLGASSRVELIRILSNGKRGARSNGAAARVR